MSYEKERAIAEAATQGPWEWANGHLTTAWAEPAYPRDIKHTVLSSWGYGSTSEIEVSDENRAFMETFHPKRVLELLNELEAHKQQTQRLRDQNTRLMAGNFTAAERIDWLKKFNESDTENRELRARLKAVKDLYEKRSNQTVGNFTEEEELFLADLIQAVRGE